MMIRERSVEEIASAQLEYDVAEARQALEKLLGLAAHDKVGAIESLIGRVVMRWWFARIVKNRENQASMSQESLESRRRVRAATLIAVGQAINSRAFRGEPPGNLDLQLAVLDVTAAQNAIWQALIDAAIISPQAKQDYLDGGVNELFGRVSAYAQRIDLINAGAAETQVRN